MGKVNHNGILFDSQLEVDYYEYLIELKEKGEINWFRYHSKNPIYINAKSTYTPDFIVAYNDRIEIIETKGYNQFSYQRDSIIHNVMIEKTKDELKQYLKSNDIDSLNLDIKYRKIKYLKSFGWVNFDFKNPNTLANKRKDKILDLEAQIKVLKHFKSKAIKYITLTKKGEKLSKKQQEFMIEFEGELNNVD